MNVDIHIYKSIISGSENTYVYLNYALIRKFNTIRKSLIFSSLCTHIKINISPYFIMSKCLIHIRKDILFYHK